MVQIPTARRRPLCPVVDTMAGEPGELTFRHGYVDGCAAALIAFDHMLREPGAEVAAVMARADDHMLFRLVDWLDDPAPTLPPEFDEDAPREERRPATSEQEIARTLPDYRLGYVSGWDATIDRLGVLILACETPCLRALEMAVQQLKDRMYPWLTGTSPMHMRMRMTETACTCPR